jgi:hypothetical protein
METVAQRIGRYTMTTLDGPATADLPADELRAVLNVRKPKRQVVTDEPRAGDEWPVRIRQRVEADGA